MKNHEIKFKSKNNNYSIIIGKNAIKLLPRRIKLLCPRTRNIAIIIDKKVPTKFKRNLVRILKNYNLSITNFNANEKNKSIKTVNHLLKTLFHLSLPT